MKVGRGVTGQTGGKPRGSGTILEQGRKTDTQREMDEEEEGEGRGTRRKKRPRMRKKRRKGRKKGNKRNVRKSGEAGLGIYLSIRMCISSCAILGYMRERKKENQFLNLAMATLCPIFLSL